MSADSCGLAEGTKLVWFPHERAGFAIGRLADIGPASVAVKPLLVGSSTSVQLVDSDTGEPPEVRFEYSRVFPCGPQLERALLAHLAAARRSPLTSGDDQPDNCALKHLNEAALLENVRSRFFRDQIYTYVAHILIAVNPYKQIAQLHSPQTIESYQGKSLGSRPPHVFAIADKAYRDMRATKRSQSIIINGESGAGKTESQKYVLRYLCSSGQQQATGRLEQLILDANPLLEAFGNAKTMRNNNSSRFGKFIEIHYSSQFHVIGGLFQHYLLEKSRVCSQTALERNYHIFYQLCACLPAEQWRELHLGPPDRFRYLASGCTRYFCDEADAESGQIGEVRQSARHLAEGPMRDQLIDDTRCYRQTDAALTSFGLSQQEKAQIYAVVAAVLHLGNIDIEEGTNSSSKINAELGESSLAVASRLLGVDVDLLRQSLLTRLMSTTRGGHMGTMYMVQLSVQQASAARDALAKTIYARLFDHIVARIINRSIPSTAKRTSQPEGGQQQLYIGVLDVADFEHFEHNGFEQLLINFCNEKLQHFFNLRILEEEQAIYESEALALPRVHYSDNQDCMELFERRANGGLFQLLDEESRLPKPSSEHFTQALFLNNKSHPRLAHARLLKKHRDVRDDEGFVIRHFAGQVCYQTAGFIEKNNDALHGSLRELMAEAEQPLVKLLFGAPASQPAASPAVLSLHSGAADQAKLTNKLSFVSVASNFRSQLQELMDKLQSTGSHFVRCIKPNDEMVAHKFVGSQILQQLHCSGTISVLSLMQRGFPSRVAFHELYAAYAASLPDSLRRLDPHLFCRALFKALGMRDSDFRFGASKVFFRPGKFAAFDELVKTDDQRHVLELVRRVSSWLAGARWRKTIYCAWSVVKLAAKLDLRRRCLVELQARWRGALVRRQVGAKLKLARQCRTLVHDLDKLDQMLGKLRPHFQPRLEQLHRAANELLAELRHKSGQAELGEALTELTKSRDALMAELREKLAKQRELDELEERLKREQQERDEQDRVRQAELETRRQRQAMEARRQMEALQLTSAGEQPAASRVVAPSENFAAHAQLGECKYAAELAKWKYSDLRDTINTSCDLELLEACKREFHRRLKVYHAWRAANTCQQSDDGASPGRYASRAPESIVRREGVSTDADGKQQAANEQRYFRIPFSKPPVAGEPLGGRGWWFAHFDGQWIARQLELHPSQKPLLLVAGQHDIDMCELSLRETRLTSKRGAEILASEFEDEWQKHGGPAYNSTRHLAPARTNNNLADKLQRSEALAGRRLHSAAGDF